MAGRGERWDRDRFAYEREERDRDRYDDDRYTMRGGRGGRDHSDDRYDRRPGRPYDDDDIGRGGRFHDDDPRFAPQREREREPEYERRVVIDKERDRDYRHDSSPRRPAFLRRQSSLDTYDRKPLGRNFYEREEYPAPARREDIYRDDYRAPAYTPIPLPKSRGLPPPRRGDRSAYDEINVAEPDFYGDDDYRPYPERIHERELVRTRQRRSRSRDTHTTRAHTHRSSSRSSTTTHSSSTSGGTTVVSEYPKKGKTRIPVRLVSKRAIIELGYPFVEEGTTLIVQKALGQDNIDQLLKLSEEYKKSENEVAAARSSAGDIEDRREIFVPPPTQAPPTVAPQAPSPIVIPPPPPPAPVIIEAGPARAPPVEVVDNRSYYREPSPSTTTTSSWDSHHPHHHGETMEIAHRSRSQSQGRNGREIRAEIRALERELEHRPKHSGGEREIVRAERLPDGQLVVYEESVEQVQTTHKPARLEKDKKGPPPRLMRAMLSTLT